MAFTSVSIRLVMNCCTVFTDHNEHLFQSRVTVERNKAFSYISLLFPRTLLFKGVYGGPSRPECELHLSTTGSLSSSLKK